MSDEKAVASTQPDTLETETYPDDFANIRQQVNGKKSDQSSNFLNYSDSDSNTNYTSPRKGYSQASHKRSNSIISDFATFIIHTIKSQQNSQPEFL